MTTYVCGIYSAISKSPKHLPNCLNIAKTSVVLIVFNGVIWDVTAYTVPFPSVAPDESRIRNALLGL